MKYVFSLGKIRETIFFLWISKFLFAISKFPSLHLVHHFTVFFLLKTRFLLNLISLLISLAVIWILKIFFLEKKSENWLYEILFFSVFKYQIMSRWIDFSYQFSFIEYKPFEFNIIKSILRKIYVYISWLFV